MDPRRAFDSATPLPYRRTACLLMVLSWLGPASPSAGQSLLRWVLDQKVIETTAMVADYPRLGGLTAAERQQHVEFVTGNTLFVLGHEAGHALISEMGIAVLGREEDAADVFSALVALQIGNAFADRVLINAATGWFYSNRRDRQDHVKMTYYDEHGIDLQRAYNIVCLMVGSDPKKFGELADEAGIPEERQGTCQGDYSNASWSWNKVLEPHRRRPEQPRTEIKTVYGPAEGELAIFAQVARHMQILETMADMLAEEYVWRAPISLELQTCGEAGARWDLTTKQVIVCYEIVAEFSQLYRSYRKTQAFAIADDDNLEVGAAPWRRAPE